MSWFATACAITSRPADLLSEGDPLAVLGGSPGFERGMSLLTMAVAELERHPPQTKAQHNRLSDQTARIARVEVSSEQALMKDAA